MSKVIGGAFGGKGGSAPRAPVISADNVRSTAILELVEAIAEGEIEGFATEDPRESIYLDNTPLRADGVDNFQGVSVDWRPGTQSQTFMAGENFDGASTPVDVNVNVTFANAVTRTISSAVADALRITLTFEGLKHRNPDTGDETGSSVQLLIEVRPSGGVYAPVGDGPLTVKGKTSSAYQRSYQVDLKQFGSAPYDVRVSRVSPDPDPNTTANAFAWSSYAEIIYAKLRYPNTAVVRMTVDAKHFERIPVRGYLMKGTKVRVPNAAVYDPIARTYNTEVDWDGSFQISWTRNPAWIFYDLISDPRYGLGKEVKAQYIDKWELFTIAKRCDELVSDGRGNTEHRYSMDLFIQDTRKAKQVINDIASNFDAMGFWHDKAVFVTQDAPKTVSALYMPGNVIDGRFVYAGSSRQVRYTVVLVQWNDPDDFYRIATEYVEDPEGIDRYGYRETTITAIGCTSRSQAHRLGKRMLLTSRLETDAVTFQVGLSGLRNKPGDIIRIADPLRAEGERWGGRISSDSTVSQVALDSPVTLAAGKSYRVAIVDDEGKVVDKPVTSASGTHSAITVQTNYTVAPEREQPWIIYDADQPGKRYRILWIKEKEGGAYELSAVTYAPEKYALIESGLQLPPLPPNRYSNTSKVDPPGIPLVSDGVFVGMAGLVRYIDISWVPSGDKMLRNHVVVWSVDNGEPNEVKVDGAAYRIVNPTEGLYTITLFAESLTGMMSTSSTVEYTLGELYAIDTIEITGLGLQGGGATFAGRDVQLVWDTNADTVLNISGFSSGPGGQTPWFRDFEIKVYSGETLLRTDHTTESSYVYTFEKNIEDGGPRRALTFKIAARDLYNRLSAISTLAVSNPAPPSPSSVNVYAGIRALVISYQRPADNDFVGVAVFVSETEGFTPGAGNLAYIGADATITVPNLLENTPYFIRIASYDAFGGADDYTLSPTEYTKTITSASLPSPEDVKGALQTALDDPAATPLVFESDLLAIRMPTLDKAPFIIGEVGGLPAILMDSDVYITSTLSAAQIRSGRIDASENIIVGEGNLLINGDGSIIAYDGPDTVNNRDFAILTGGTLSFQRYRDGAYRDYKSVKRVEYGIAASGVTVELPGYWDTQPKIFVSPASLQSYDANFSESSQTWIVRADNLTEFPAASGQWEFDAIAELAFSDSSGQSIVSDFSGPLGVESWTTTAITLPGNTASIVVNVSFSSVRGDGLSSNQFFFRSVNFKIQTYDADLLSWVDAASKTRSLSAAEHGLVIQDSLAANIPAGHSEIRLEFLASDTNGTKYTSGQIDYETNEVNVATNGASVKALAPTNESLTTTVTLTGPEYNPPANWEVYQVQHSAQYRWRTGEINTSTVRIVKRAIGGGVFYNNVEYLGSIHNSGAPGFKASDEFNEFHWRYNPSPEGAYMTITTAFIATDAYNRTFWQCSARGTSMIGATEAKRPFSIIQNASAIVRIRKEVAQSATPANDFRFNNYNWEIVGSTAIATGSLNWMAIGD